MRIAHVISSPSGIGGAERTLLALVQAGVALGCEQRVFHPFADQTATVLGELSRPVSYLAEPCAHWRSIPHVRAWLQRELRQFDPEIVHVHLLHAQVLVASMPRTGTRKLLLTHHHGSLYAGKRRFREMLDWISGHRYDAIVAVSRSARRLLADRYRYNEEKLWTIPNGWSGNPIPRARLPGHRVISIGNFRPEKGQDVLLNAFARVTGRVIDAQLTLVGDGPLRPDLEAQARTLGIGTRVHFTGSVTDVWPLLAEADIFAVPSRYESMGIAALEAMAAGLPVVATSVGGLTDLVQPGVTGELVEPDDPGALADRLTSLLLTPEALASLGAAAQERAESYRAETMADRYFAVYEDLAQEPIARR